MNRLLNWLHSKSVERAKRRQEVQAWNDYVRARVAIQRNARAVLEADVATRRHMVGKPYSKRRQAALKGRAA